MKGRPLALLLLVSTLGRTSFAAPDATERAFRAGNALLEKGKYAEALAQYRIVLKAEPDEPSSLWNGGGAAYFTHDYKTAATFFARLQKQEPNNGHLIAKRIQTAQEIADFKTRDMLRTRLFALHKSGKDSTGYATKDSYCRDQFEVGKDKVLAYEYFELKPLSGKKDEPYLGRRFDFYVMGPDEKQKIRIECGWSSLDVTADGKFVPSHEMPAFYFDAYYPTGPWSRRTFGLGPTEPSFEATKAQIVSIIQGKAKPVSGEKRS
ncbi:hypothetical protein IAD21_04066 [Abditibacteriota bacterium]|nr:hypothetical protein IAD21_04066 [Abditibacteriota bacterium]